MTVWVLGFWVAHALAATSAQSEFERALHATRTGDHVAAVEGFRSTLDAGGIDPHVYHGLGNALYRLDRPGLAIAAWRRGLSLAPRNGDIAANLGRAQREITDRLPPSDDGVGPFFWQPALSLRESTLLAAGGLSFAMLIGLLGAARRLEARVEKRPVRAGLKWWVVILGGIGLLLTASTLDVMRRPAGAVVILAQVSARSTLGPDGVELFVLHKGAEVQVIEREGGDALVELGDARKGWVSVAGLVSTDPSDPFPDPSTTGR